MMLSRVYWNRSVPLTSDYVFLQIPKEDTGSPRSSPEYALSSGKLH